MGMEVRWRGEGVNEVGFDANAPVHIVVRVSEKYFRPAEVETLLGNASKARTALNWSPTTPFEQLVREMVTNDMEKIAKTTV